MSQSRRVFRFVFLDHETSWWFALMGTLVYGSFLIWIHSQHELWRDEVHCWTLARVADGFWDIVTGDRVYDGHPPLWYWYLRVWSFVTHRPWGAHAAAILPMAAAALLLLRWAPFARPLKLLLLASYQFGYEYGAMSRNYTLGWLTLVAFCCAYHPLRPRLIWLSSLLALMAITSAFGTFIACAMFLTLVPLGMSVSSTDSAPGFFRVEVRSRLLVAAALFAVALVFFVLSTAPPDPNPDSPAWNFDGLSADGLEIALKRLVYALLPVRGLSDPGYWTAHGYFWDNDEKRLLAVAFGLLVLIPLALVPRWSTVAAFLVGVALILGFMLVRYGGGMRHLGNLLILLVGVCWIKRRQAPSANHWLSTAVLVVVGLFHHESLWAAARQERTRVFSEGEQMARWIEHAGLQDLPIVAGPPAFALTVTGCLDRVFITADSEEINQTMVFHARHRPFSAPELVERAVALVRSKHHPVLVLSSFELSPPPQAPELKFSPLFHTPLAGTGQLEESYFLYRMEE